MRKRRVVVFSVACCLPALFLLYLASSDEGGGQLDEWKWDCRRLMLLNVSMCLVATQRLWDQYQSEDSVPEDLFQADHELQHLQKTVFSSFGTKEKNHYCAAARCRPLSSIRKKNLRYYGAKSSSQCRSVCKKTSCVRYPQRTTAKEPLMLGKENMFLGSNNGLLCCSQTSPDLQWRVIQGVY
ncbi:metabotropic glutamate receptor 3 [Trichonephila clavipes]|nr:metabotropic glutamate receptor 3 [Trichonephila clavipes]